MADRCLSGLFGDRNHYPALHYEQYLQTRVRIMQGLQTVQFRSCQFENFLPNLTPYPLTNVATKREKRLDTIQPISQYFSNRNCSCKRKEGNHCVCRKVRYHFRPQNRWSTDLNLIHETCIFSVVACTCRSDVGAYSYLQFSPFHLLLPSQRSSYYSY